MKISALLCLAAVMLLSSCASPSQYRARHFPEKFSALSPEEQADVRVGVVRQGMSRDAVFIAWGAPPRIIHSHHHGKDFERWIYPTVRTSYAGYYGYGGVGYAYYHHHRGFAFYDPVVYPVPAVAYVREHRYFVEFMDDRVVAYAAP